MSRVSQGHRKRNARRLGFLAGKGRVGRNPFYRSDDRLEFRAWEHGFRIGSTLTRRTTEKSE